MRTNNGTLLNRLGNKSKLLTKLLPLFPKNITTFIDMFMGSGAVTFAMTDRAKYVIANDKNGDVFNLFMAVKEHKQELEDAIRIMPIHEDLFKHWKESRESQRVWKATRFLMLSNFGYMGKPGTLRFSTGRMKIQIFKQIESVFKKIQNVMFMHCDFKKIFSDISWRHGEDDKQQAFIYADPPYLGTANNYTEDFTEEDTQDLFSVLINSGIRFAVSEFRHPLVMALAKEHDLHITSLGERQNMKNRREEILITNYQPAHRQASLFPEAPTAHG